MRRLIVSTFLSLDGVFQGPGGPHEDESGGFTHGGWTVPFWDQQMADAMGEAVGAPFDLLLGRKTYEIFAAHWPDAPAEEAKPFNNATKYVASRSHPSLDWTRSVLIEGDAGQGIALLKQTDGPELQVHGSGDLVQTLLRRKLIDEYRLWTFPIVLGYGKRLFAEGTVPWTSELVDSAVSSTGVVMSTYRPRGDVITGSFALDAD